MTLDFPTVEPLEWSWLTIMVSMRSECCLKFFPDIKPRDAHFARILLLIIFIRHILRILNTTNITKTHQISTLIVIIIIIMQVSTFMKPADKVITVEPTDSIRQAMDLMLAHKIGAIVVLVTGTYHVPIGIITKTDLVHAYSKNLTLDHPVREVMSKDLLTCTETMSRDRAAGLMEKNKTHHMIVVEEGTQHFRGMVSSWDITVECARDDRAWPWNRSKDGRFHKPDEKLAATSPTISTTAGVKNERPVVRRSQMGDSFRNYVDLLELNCFEM
jgi:CBS domain-containing protein